MKQKVIILSVIIIVSLFLWWAYYIFLTPHFEAGPNNTFVSKNVKLELVTTSPEPEKLGINVPATLPFWKIIGKVDGGTLWEFTDKGKKYVLYAETTEMGGRYIYRYTEK